MFGKKNIYLVGPMGAGKSTIGRVLSEMTNMKLIDSDAEIESRTGANIAWIFDVEGEVGFRKREEDTILDLTTKHENIILATGGGSVKNANNRKNLKENGFVVYLETSVEQQFARTGRDKRRPLINNDNPKETLAKLLQERDPLYREVADIVVSTDNLSATEIATTIIKQFEAKQK